MKPILILVLSIFTIKTVTSQIVSFKYDESGNRTSRSVTIGLKSTKSINDSSEIEKNYSDQIDEIKITLFPNPVTSTLTVNISGWKEELNSKIYLFDQNGRLITALIETSDNNILDFTGLAPGLYIVNIEIKGKSSKWNIIKQ